MNKHRTDNSYDEHTKLPKEPFCQSCGMPMKISECFGTNTDKTKNNDYCCHCFQNGDFVEPQMTMEEMIDLVTSIMIEKMEMSETDAKTICQAFIPTLKRWNSLQDSTQ